MQQGLALSPGFSRPANWRGSCKVRERAVREVHTAGHSSGHSSSVNHGAALALRSSLFSGASSAACQEIISVAHERKFESAQAIFCQGDSVKQVLLLISGCVKLLQVGANGHEVMLRLSGPGELIGIAELHTRTHNSTARAQQPCTALAWDISTFETIFERHAFLRRNILSMLLHHLEDMHERFREISTDRVAARLSSQIIRMMHQVGRQVDGGTEISISREELAQLTGTTLFTVSRLLSDWDRQGIVAARREVVSVRNLAALVDLSETAGRR
jgi:CRP/FNR family transcriptional regulator, nitrogen oxide reductase regulator